jgi:anaerobic selenocysteine-containing dehydrogenase
LFVKEAREQLDAEMGRAVEGLVLIGRRQLRSNNSWMHNAQRLVKGRVRCTLLVHPEDAAHACVRDGDTVHLQSAAGSIAVPVEVTDAMMPGVVSLPHGWGHDRDGTRLSVAREHAGASVNDVTSEEWLDTLSGTAAFNGVPVEVTKVT